MNDRRLDEETGTRRRFQSSILPPYVRHSPKVTDVLPLLCLHGLSTRDFVPALAEFFGIEDRTHADVALERFAADFSRWPKGRRQLTSDREALLAFYELPAEHWIHLRTSNPIESTFSAVRARTNVTKGPGSRQAGLAMCFKLIEAAEGRWRRINAPELVALVRASAKFVNGKLAERGDQGTPRDH